jgi:hypothetical protein
MAYEEISNKIMPLFMLLLFVVPRAGITGGNVIGDTKRPGVFTVRQETAPNLNVWSYLGTRLNGQPGQKKQPGGGESGQSNARSSLGAELDRRLDQESKQLDQENRRLQKMINLLNKQKEAERKREQIREKSSLTDKLDTWADMLKRNLNQTNNLEKKLGSIGRMLSKLQPGG